MDRETALIIERVTAMVLIALLLIVDALTWKIDHAIWTMGIAAISGLAGYNIGRYQAQNSKVSMNSPQNSKVPMKNVGGE